MVTAFSWLYLAMALWFTFRIYKADNEVSKYLNFTTSLLLLVLSHLCSIIAKL